MVTKTPLLVSHSSFYLLLFGLSSHISFKCLHPAIYSSVPISYSLLKLPCPRFSFSRSQCLPPTLLSLSLLLISLSLSHQFTLLFFNFLLLLLILLSLCFPFTTFIISFFWSSLSCVLLPASNLPYFTFVFIPVLH